MSVNSQITYRYIYGDMDIKNYYISMKHKHLATNDNNVDNNYKENDYIWEFWYDQCIWS